MMPNDQKELARQRALAALAQIPGVTDVMEEADSAQPVGASGGLPMPDYRPLGGPRDANPAVTSAVEGVESGKPGAPEEAAFERALSAASKRRATAGYWRAVESLQAGLSNRAADRSYSEALLGEADSPVREYMQRKAMRAEQAKLQREASLRDPNSPESQRFRAVVGKTLPGVYAPEELAMMTAADEDSLLKYGSMRASLEERKLAREQSASLAQSAAEDRKLAREQQAQQFGLALSDRRDARAAAAEERKLRQSLLEQTRADTAAAKQDERAERQQTDFAKQYSDSGAPGFYAKYDEVKAILDANPKDLPGFGVVAGRMPDAVTSEAGVRLRQAIGQMLAEYRKGITGAGMSNAEREEFGRITGLLESGTEERVRLGVQGLKEAMDRRSQALAAGYRPDVVKAYAKRTPGFPASALEAAGVAPAQPAATGPDVDLTQPPAPQERKQYSKSRNQTRVVDAQGNVLRIEEGDTRGR